MASSSAASERAAKTTEAAERPAVFGSNPITLLWSSVIGKKVVMAVTGVLMVLFVIAHMVGNLKIFSGPGRSTPTRGFCAKWDAGTGLRRCAVDRPHRAAGLRDAAHHRGHAAHAHELAGAAGGLRERKKMWRPPGAR